MNKIHLHYTTINACSSLQARLFPFFGLCFFYFWAPLFLFFRPQFLHLLAPEVCIFMGSAFLHFLGSAFLTFCLPTFASLWAPVFHFSLPGVCICSGSAFGTSKCTRNTMCKYIYNECARERPWAPAWKNWAVTEF